MPVLPMLQVQADQQRSCSKSTASVPEDDDENSSRTTLENSGEHSKEVTRIMRRNDPGTDSAESAPGRLQYNQNEELGPQARSQSLLVEHPRQRTSLLQQILAPFPLPKLLGGRGLAKSKVTVRSVPSFSSTPSCSHSIEDDFSRPPNGPAVLRARTCDWDGVHGLRSPDLDRDPSDAWSLMPNASFAPAGPSADCATSCFNSHMSCATDKSDRGTLQSMRRGLLELFEEPFGSCSAWVLSVFLIINNSTSFILLCMEGPVAESSSKRRDVFQSSHGQVQLAVNVICTIEALLRFWCRPRQRRSLGHVPNAIDAASVLPFWLIKVVQLDTKINQPALYLACRLEFGLRLLKLCRYFEGWQLLFLALSDAIPALMLPLVALGYIVGLGACMILIAEEANVLAGGEETTLSGFPHALMFCWLCIVAIDEGPFWELEIQSKGGRLIVGVLMMCGLVVFAMPISIVGTCFCRVWFQRHRLLFLEALRRRVERETITDTTTTLRELFDSFDHGHTGELGLHEFKWFTRSVFPWLSAATVLTIFSSFDQDQDGTVSFQEVQAAVFPDEADLEFLINVAEERELRESEQQEFTIVEEENDGNVKYDSHGSVLYESHASGGSNEKEKESDFKSVKSEEMSRTGGASAGPRNSHTSSHSAAAQAAATAQTVRLLGVLDNRLRSLEKRQHEIPITPWYALAPPSPAKSLLSTRRSSLKSQPARGSSTETDVRPHSTNAIAPRGHWSSQNSIRSSKVSNISAAYTDVTPRHCGKRQGRDFDDASSVHGIFWGTSQLPSASSSRCPSVVTSVMSPGERRLSTAALSGIPDISTGSRTTRSSQSSASRENFWASSRRNTISGVLGRAGMPEELMAVQDESQEDEMSNKSEAGDTSKMEIPVMHVTRAGTQNLPGTEEGPNPAANPAAVLSPPKLKSKRTVSSSPSRRVSRSSSTGIVQAGAPGVRRLSTEPSAVASLARRLSSQGAEQGDELSFATGNDVSWNIPQRRNERRMSSQRPSTREAGAASNSNSPSANSVASAAQDNSHLR